MAGRVTRRNTYQRDAPSVRAASSKRVSSWRNAASTVMHEERHGDERLGDDDPGGRERQREPEPAVEVLADAGRGGRASRTARRRRRPAAAPSTACTAPAPGRGPGTPPGRAATPAARRTATPRAVAHSEHHNDSRSAVSALSEVRIDQTSPHGAFHNSPRNGRAKKAMAMIRRGRGAGTGSRSLPDPAVGRDGVAAAAPSSRHGEPKPYSAMIAWPSSPGGSR